MYASISKPDIDTRSHRAIQHQRIKATASVAFKHDGERTRIDRLYQHASAKIRFPKVYQGALEAVLINTAGGLTGGDELDWRITLGERTQVVATTQACEKAYQSSAGVAEVRNVLGVADGATLHWLPQETILYNGSALDRSIDVDLAEGAEFLAIEAVVLGREAMGENPENLAFTDHWRIRKNGGLIFADEFRLDERCNAMAQMNGNRVVATLVYVGNEDDETLRQMARRLGEISASVTSGFSAFEGKLTGRFVCSDTYRLRQILVPVLKQLRGADLPRVWRI